MCIARRISRAAGGAVAVFVAAALLAPMAGGETADEWADGEWSEHLTEIDPPEGYVLQDIKESPEGGRALALAVPDPSEKDVTFWLGHWLALVVLGEEGKPEQEIGPATFDFELTLESLRTASWSGDGEWFVFVAYPPLGLESEIAELEEIKEELQVTGSEQEGERYNELVERRRELNDKLGERVHHIHIHRPALFRWDAATGGVDQLWDINQQVLDVDVDGEGFIHVAARDGNVYVLTPEGDLVTSHAIPELPTASDATRRLDASFQTVWATMSVWGDKQDERDFYPPRIGSYIVRLRYGGDEPGEWRVVVDDASLVDMDSSGRAVLYYSEGPGYVVYDLETGERTNALATLDFLGDPSSKIVEGPNLARGGAAMRFRVIDVERGHRADPVKRWENTTLYEYTLPE